jgi:Mg-chelatase subunit ChlD
MTTFNKAMTLMRIDEMRPLTATNLWNGIRDGLGLFGEAEAGSDGRVPALLVLTDGAPNFWWVVSCYTFVRDVN